MIASTGKSTTLDGGSAAREQRNSIRNLEALLEISKALNSSLRLNDDDVVVVFSDGITEANNPAEEEYGEEALASVVVAERHQSAATMGKAVFDAVSAFSTGAPQHDDLTLMIIKYAAS